MKHVNIFLCAISSVLVFSSCANKQTYDYEQYGLNCPVKSVKVITYEAESKFGEIVKGDLARDHYLAWNRNYLATFNEVGNIESMSVYDADGGLSAVHKYKYNNDNKVSEFFVYDGDGDLEYQRIYAYNNNQESSIIHKSYWDNKEEIWEHKHKWNGEQLVEMAVIENGELSSITKYTRNDKSCSEWVTYDKDGKELSRGGETCNDQGLIVSRNEDGFHSEVQWNDVNLPIFLKNAHLVTNTRLMFFLEESTYYVEYEYDKKGNWIKQIVYEGEIKKPDTISEREITY